MLSLKEANENLSETIIEYSDYLDKVNKKAYHNVYLISNNVLSRNPFSNIFFKKLFWRSNPRKFSFFSVIKNLIIYYFRNIVLFIIWMLQKSIFLFSGLRYRKNAIKNELYIVDTFFLGENIIRENIYKDTYFNGIYDLLENNNKDFIFLPSFVNLSYFKIWKFATLFKILKKSKYNFITEYELLTLKDIFFLIKFIIVYPFSLLRLAKYAKSNTTTDKLFVESLHEDLKKTVFHNYIRYLVGKNLVKIHTKIKLISWCEYQVLCKNLYKGVHDSKANAHIYGCQFFLKYSVYKSLYIPDHEAYFGLTPDTILVNGKYYLPHNSALKYRTGVSLRYEKIFRLREQNRIFKFKNLVLLSYFERDSVDILDVLKKTKIAGKDLIVKLHPIQKLENMSKYLSKNWEIFCGDIYDVLPYSEIVITTGSGTAAEAVALGVSVIIIANQHSFTTNPLLDLGKGEIWDMAFDEHDFDEVYSQLLDYRKNNREEINDIATKYTELLFREPTEERIAEMFDF
jgi:hypothetical protein